MKGWSENYEIHTMHASCHVQKNLENKKNLRAALHCEFYIWNIQIFLTCHLIVVEIFGTEAFGDHSTRPQQFGRFIDLKM